MEKPELKTKNIKKMSYQANVYNVMIATPSDLPNVRQAAKDMIIKWNSIHALKHRIVLMPIGWETLAPTLEGSAQTIINKRLLSQADLLVAIFWNRIGTSTDAFPSGTIEEIERHLEAGKLAFLYFSDEPIAPSKINHAQSEAVQNLKKEFRSKGITYDFSTIEDFKMRFSDDLSETVNGHESYLKGFDAEVKNINQSLSPVSNFFGTFQPLSETATELLSEGAKDKSNRVWKHPMRQSPIKINQKEFGSVKDKRSLAEYYSGLDELIEGKYVKELSGEYVELTAKGYNEADTINNNQ